MKRFLVISAEDDGKRLDTVLSQRLLMSRAAVQKLISEERVLLYSKPAGKSHKACEGESFTIDIPEPRPLEVAAQDIALDIIFEDDSIIVINKPRGLVVHPAAGNWDGTLVNALLARCDGLSGIGGVIRPGIVHRLDKDTSGLIVCAKNDAAHASLAKQLAARTMKRVYMALVHGAPRDDGGLIDAPIARDTRDRKRMAVSPGGRAAVTRYETLERYAGYALVRCELQSGRTHQIRVHMAHIGHAVAGDRLYGPKKPMPGTQSQLLHAAELALTHPKTLEAMRFEAPLPEYFQKILTKLRTVD